MNRLSTALVILAGILWGVISIFINKFNDMGFNSYENMCLRAWTSVFIMFILLLVLKRDLLVIKLRDIWIFIGTGLLSLTFFSYCYFTTIVNCGAGIGVVLLYTSPIFVMLLSAVFFKEKITLKKLTALILTFIGCVLVAGIIGNGTRLSSVDFFIGLGAGFGYALYSIFAGFGVKKYSSITITFYTFVFSGLSLIVFVNPADLVKKVIIQPNNIWLYILGIALICTIIPYLCYTYGLGKLEKSKAAVLVTIEPLVGTLVGFFVYNENKGFFKIIGIILIFISVILLSAESGKEIRE